MKYIFLLKEIILNFVELVHPVCDDDDTCICRKVKSKNYARHQYHTEVAKYFPLDFMVCSAFSLLIKATCWSAYLHLVTIIHIKGYYKVY